MYTNVIHFHTNAIVDFNENYTSMRAQNNIDEGDLILIEHTISSADAAVLVNVVQQNKDLYNWLCPREISFDTRNPEICTTKVRSNSFRTNEMFVLGKYLSTINHSCDPNAFVTSTNISQFTIPITFMIVYALRDIPAGEEIQFMYGATVGHGENEYHDFHCVCTKTDIERLTLSSSIKERVAISQLKSESSPCAASFTQHREIISSYISSTLDTDLPTCTTSPEIINNILITQLLAVETGMYKLTETELCPSTRFQEYLSTVYGISEGASDTDKMSALMHIMRRIEQDVEDFIEDFDRDTIGS
jgi:hypothetical protein